MLLIFGVSISVPEDAVLLLCGYLISRNIISPIPGFVAVYSGLLVGDFLIYSIGRKYGREIVNHKRFHRIISPKDSLRLNGSLHVLGHCSCSSETNLGTEGKSVPDGRGNGDAGKNLYNNGCGCGHSHYVFSRFRRIRRRTISFLKPLHFVYITKFT